MGVAVGKWIVTVLASTGAAGSPHAADFPGPPVAPSRQALEAQAEAAFESARYAEAYRLYSEELVPLGDKYAQYMVGWMHLNGLGVDADVQRGAAWLILAGERGDPELGRLRDEVLSQLSPQGRERARSLFDVLAAEHGDCAVVQRLLDEDKAAMEAITGTRVGPVSSLPRIVTPRSAADAAAGDPLQLRTNIQERTRYLRQHCRRR